MIEENVVQIKILNEVRASVTGLKPSEYTAFKESFRLKTKDYFFNPKYKAKKWDGYINFFESNGKTYVNLLPEIIPLIQGIGYKIKLIDTRDNLRIKVPQIDKNYLSEYGWTLQDHQVNIVNSLTEYNGGIVNAGTGAGKTVCAWVLHDLYKKHCNFDTLVIVPTKDLIYQTILEFSEFCNDVGFWGDNKRDIDHPIVVSTWQTLMDKPGFVANYKHIILDECHGGSKFEGKINKILNEYGKNCYVKMGMTGTLPNNPCDFRTLQMALGDVKYDVMAKELIDINWLAKPKLKFLIFNEDFKENYEEYKKSKEYEEYLKQPKAKPLTYNGYIKILFPEFRNERTYLEKKKERNEIISEFVKEKTISSGNSIILVNTIKHGKLLEELIEGSKFIYGKDTTQVRKEMFDLFSNDDKVVMITLYALASIGLNIKRVFNLFLIDAGKSFIRVIQTLGRGLRKAIDKDSVNVYDITSNLIYSKRHLSKRFKIFEEEGHNTTDRIIINYKK